MGAKVGINVAETATGADVVSPTVAEIAVGIEVVGMDGCGSGGLVLVVVGAGDDSAIGFEVVSPEDGLSVVSPVVGVSVREACAGFSEGLGVISVGFSDEF